VNYGGYITGCLFTNLNLAMEIYQGFAQAPFTFVSNTAVNCEAGITIVGAHSNRVNVPFLISGNVFDDTGWGVIIGPAHNVTISSNSFKNLGSAVLTSAFAYQSIYATINSNIVVAYNTMTNVNQGFYNGACGEDAMVNVQITGNIASGLANNSSLANGLGCGTNVVLSDNWVIDTDWGKGVNSSALSGPYYVDEPSNRFPYYKYDDFGGYTNVLSYAYGHRHYLNQKHPNSAYRLTTANAWKIPTGAQMLVTNRTGSTVDVYMDATWASAMTLTNGGAALAYWTGAAWTTNASWGRRNIRAGNVYFR